MALNAKVTAFTWNSADAAGTNYDVSIGFTPTFMILFITGRTESTDSIGTRTLRNCIGFAVDEATRGTAGVIIVNASATANIGAFQHDAAVLNLPAGAPGRLDLVAQASWTDANTPRFTVDVQSVENCRITVLAVGGDVSEANVVLFQEPGSSGAQSVAHGLSGAPTGAFFLTSGMSSAPPGSTFTQSMLSFGCSDGTRNWVQYFGGDDAAADMDTVSYCRSGECIALGSEPAVTLDGRASVTSFDGTNINLSWSERASTRYIFALVFRGGQFRADTTATRTDTTQFDGPSNGFVAGAALFASACRAEDSADTPTAHGQASLGVATGSTERMAQATLDEDAVAASECTAALETDEVYINIDTGSAVQGLMDVVDLTVDPMQLVMDDADPSASFVGVASWGATAAAGGDRPSLIGGKLVGRGLLLKGLAA